MGTIAKVNLNGTEHLIASTAYATCSTEADTAAKVATIQNSQDFTLINGTTIHVYFTYSNTASSPTLNINNTGAKPIRLYANNIPSGGYWGNSWKDKSIVSFTYNTDLVSTGCWLMNDATIQTANSVLFDYQGAETDYGVSLDADNVYNAIIEVYDQTKNVNSDWTATTGTSSILNKPSVPSTYSDVGAASAAHVHGNITNAGAITSTATITSGDRLVISDTSASSKLINSGITFGSSTTSFLANNGTWQTPATAATPSAADISYTSSGILGPTNVQDAIDQAYENLAVTVTPVVTSGTNIANIAVGQEIVSLYSPASSVAAHASSSTTYGAGTSTLYGHVKLSDSTSSTSGAVSGVAATPSAVKAVADSIPTAASLTPKMDGTGAAGSSSTYARADHVHPTDTSRASSSHTHGNITNAGDITATATIASGDRLVINDESASKVTNSTITFGSSTTSYLANNGTWQTLDASYVGIDSADTAYSYNNVQSALDDLDDRAPIYLTLDFANDEPDGATIYSHLNEGRKPILYYYDDGDKTYYYLAAWRYTSNSDCYFSFIGRGDGDTIRYAIYENGTWDWQQAEFADRSHTHGAILNDGTIYTSVAIASGDKIAIVDSSDSDKLKKSSLTFGSATNSYLANDGTWQGIPGSKVTINSVTYDIASQTKTSVSGVTGLLITPDTTDANVDPIFLPDATSMQSAMNTITAAIPSSASDVGAASATHSHGSITSDGKITDAGITIGSGDALVVTDSSASNTIKKTSITFGTSTTSFLANNGTWQTPSSGSGTSVEEIYIAEYNVTTETELEAARSSDKIIFCKYYDNANDQYDYLPLMFYDASRSEYRFSSIITVDGSQFLNTVLCSQGTWSYTNASTDLSLLTKNAWYGTSSTTASTAAKVVTCSSYVLRAGNIVGVLFTTANTAATPTLNVNSTGAKTIYVGNATINATTNVLKWSANTMVYFLYDGTYYRYMYASAAASVTQPRGANTWYGTSSTAAATQAKTSTIDNFVLTKGAIIVINFTYANTYNGTITLNINSTGAKNVYYKNAATSSTNKPLWKANSTVTFVYNGSYYYIVSITPTASDENLFCQAYNSDEAVATSYTGSTSFISMPVNAIQYSDGYASWSCSSDGGLTIPELGIYEVHGIGYCEASPSTVSSQSRYRMGMYLFSGQTLDSAQEIQGAGVVDEGNTGQRYLATNPVYVSLAEDDKLYLKVRMYNPGGSYTPQSARIFAKKLD